MEFLNGTVNYVYGIDEKKSGVMPKYWCEDDQNDVKLQTTICLWIEEETE